MGGSLNDSQVEHDNQGAQEESRKYLFFMKNYSIQSTWITFWFFIDQLLGHR